MSDDVGVCASCGRALDAHDLDLRFQLPDVVFAIPASQRDASWGKSPGLEVDGYGSFLRALLPVQLTDDHHITYGTWLKLDPATLREARRIWDEPAYADLVVAGELANAIRPWGKDLLGARATARVRDITQIPYIEESDHELLSHVLTRVWPHELVLSTIPRRS